ncbi:protein YLS7 [Musa acuminata AAA Group]|uniref:protein YLS7 n=1 Tax=Musa acuminata AAA Group TaxID=214697 RepID=UPI0031D416B7
MTMSSPKHFSARSIFNITASVGGLALFLIIASLVLVPSLLGSAFHDYLLGVDRYRMPDSVSLVNSQTEVLLLPPNHAQDGHNDTVTRESSPDPDVPSSLADATKGVTDGTMVTKSESTSEAPNLTKVIQFGDLPSPAISNGSGKSDLGNSDDDLASSNDISAVVLPSSQPADSRLVDSRSCDLYSGKWIYDPAGPLYTNNTCPMITQMQNCQGNGRPDKDYENWRWKPERCNLPRFDARKFLELMRGKTLAFVGDSVARNQMESMLCILWQVEAPKNRGNRRMQRWYFRSTSTTIIRIWSSWLVHKTSETFQSVPDSVVKVHLDLPDEDFMEYLPKFDVVVLSSGHWFAKQSAYILNSTLVGGQLWWPKKAGKMQINNIEAFGVSVESCLTAIASHPNFTGLAIVRSYSPDHYEGGAWNTGGSCTGKVRPVSTVVRNGFTDVMHEKQVSGFERAVKRAGAGSKLRLMDITEPFGYRPDGHPGPYRSPDPKKITKRGPNGEPPPQDCLHWCMPGPIDTWNEILLEVIRREFEDKQ